MSSPFPLLRLPRLVLGEVFKSLNLGEKIKLSLCSKKVSTQINNNRLYSQKVIVDLDCSRQKIIRVLSENDKDTFQISIHPDSDICPYSTIQQCSMLCSTVRVMSIQTGIKTFWENNQKEGYLSFLRHLLKIFQCKFSTDLSLYYSDLFEPIISELFALQVEFKEFTLLPFKNHNLLWNQISSNLEMVEYLTIVPISDTGFRPVFNSWPQNITIWSSDWFTLESLLECTCTRITLWGSLLKNKELDEILREWRAGELPNLKHLTIASLNFKDNGEHILGMNPLELDGMVIQTDDGSKTATIKLGHRLIKMSVTPFQ
ncbi:hypothetical protein CRE_31519 [Caenorhabditis remanei]|uniref:F-box domain-containing protein n=1 Tax=Caenorhabditis remanei TaxID=31234 RepID=E3NGG1_CAERE|nr:hypothetical protein CRE_31519 [Caenorhabditis remanei]